MQDGIAYTCNALVICNQRRAGDSRGKVDGKVLCFYFSIVPAVQRKCQGFVLYSYCI